MKILSAMFIVFSLATATGCSDASKEIEKFADRACACKDAECATKVAEEFAAWAKKNKDASGDEEKAAKAAERMATCMIGKGMDPGKLMEAMSGI